MNSTQQKYLDKQQPRQQQKEVHNPCLYYIISWILFIIAFGIYVVVFAINKYGCNFAQTSYYYRKSFVVSSYASDSVSASDSTGLVSGNIQYSPLAIAMSLLYSWMLVKGPLLVFTYALIEQQTNRLLRFISFGVTVFILLATDILLFIFVLEYYSDWIYYGWYAVLTIILAIINNCGTQKFKPALYSSFISFLLIAFFYVCHVFFFPALYNVYTKNLGLPDVMFLQIYLYPLFDWILFTILLIGNYFVGDYTNRFISMVQFQLLGYGVGMTLLVGYTQVQFYYLIGYFIFRNVFVNWILWRFQKILNIPSCLPGWGLIYYISFLLNFVPLIGIGRLVISYSYYTTQWSKTDPILYSTSNPDYASNSYFITEINNKFIGRVFWIAGIVIWLGMTISQKYPRYKPEWKDFFYYLVGIYLFYLGISSALQITMLKNVSIP